MNPRTDPLLVQGMRDALLAEFGARAIYAALARRAVDEELQDLLGQFHQEECEQVDALRLVMTALGVRSKERSRRRSAMAWLIALSTRIGGMPLALRLCLESELTVERWYLEYANHLEGTGAHELAVRCESLATTKGRHARALAAWVEH
jgi:rubrerythrin